MKNSDQTKTTIKKLNYPWRITFDTNPDDCNLSCIMCEEFSEFSNLKELHIEQGMPKKRRMNYEIIKTILNKNSKDKGLREIIPSTMGEPLLYKHFPDILEYCRTYGIKLNLTTNGTFPRVGRFKNVSDWAESIVPVTSDIKISWNGATKLTQEKIMKKSNYEKGLANIKDFIAIRDRHYQSGGNYCRVTLQVTFMESNYSEFPELLLMAVKMGVDRIKGHHLWAHFDQIKNESMKRNSDSIHRWNAIVKKMYELRLKNPLPNGKLIILDNFYLLEEKKNNQIIDESWECPFLGKEAWIAWDGRFNPCCAPDEQRKSLGYFGNVTEKSIEEIWNSEQYQDLIENYKTKALCKICNMRRPME